MNDEIMRNKIKEMIVEGQETLYSLRLAKVKLDSAGSWKKLDGFDIWVNVLLALEKYELQGNERMEASENTAMITSLTGIRKSSCATI